MFKPCTSHRRVRAQKLKEKFGTKHKELLLRTDHALLSPSGRSLAPDKNCLAIQFAHYKGLSAQI